MGPGNSGGVGATVGALMMTVVTVVALALIVSLGGGLRPQLLTNTAASPHVTMAQTTSHLG